ncbi:uncharacterized protein NECHADRAFT_42374 [Fusarium vanettenii 77-13-4]|uniref:Enoyl reductase (ER) domain-containing protein n=1 Tax=Fusarium vanettenii (strain ATCC MYA-4622 / CBS 123669 / FGSC 9596 / NRRL 45880 / 77-13-4) TaxID=660122 RepID=C7ZHT7_FUSV7|nr:uncharacterized protein NECHADRAFT_42374 [Fusarium vanettenii 77-13-4]EEU36571.1 hypothetical protein NECHADRAFT_42374 [Fusarium vanettenii 77-13-4]
MAADHNTVTRAVVCRGPLSEGKWAIELLTLQPLKETDLKVKVLSVGLCHTDLTIGSTPQELGAYPGVLGHEGCGIVLDIGSKVTAAKVGDRVLLSFRSCKSCTFCNKGEPSYCSTFTPLNMGLGSHPRTFATDKEGLPVKGFFFGQSSFCEITTVSETSVVNVSDHVQTDDDLKLLSPLGCGLQTGAGAIMKLQDLNEDDSVAIVGLGAASKIRGIKTVIAIDRVQSRLDLAKHFGATHTLDSSRLGNELVPAVQGLTEGLGASVSVDATGNLNVIKQGIVATRNLGKVCMLGVTPPGTTLDIDSTSFLGSGKQLFGSVEGGVIPTEFIPSLIQWHRQGILPIERIVKFYPAESFAQALSDMRSGDVVKPVLYW